MKPTHLHPEWMKLRGKTITFNKKVGVVLHDLASQLVIEWSDGTEEYIFKNEKYKIGEEE